MSVQKVVAQRPVLPDHVQSLLIFGVNIFSADNNQKHVDLPDKVSSTLPYTVAGNVCGNYILRFVVKSTVCVFNVCGLLNFLSRLLD